MIRRGPDRRAAAVLAALKQVGGVWFATHGPWSRPLQPGIPDIIGVKAGVTFGIEVKRPRERLRHQQEEMAHALANHGWVCARVESPADAVQLVCAHLRALQRVSDGRP